jgi:hypothetical protein
MKETTRLYASTNYNADLSWELYPSSDEILSVTAFGKLIQNPINEMFTNSSSGNVLGQIQETMQL